MYNPYMMMGQQGQGGFPGMGSAGMNPGMNPMMGMMGQSQMMQGAPAAGPMGTPGAGGEELKMFDSTQMKRGRNGHYGYLEGRGEQG